MGNELLMEPRMLTPCLSSRARNVTRVLAITATNTPCVCVSAREKAVHGLEKNERTGTNLNHTMYHLVVPDWLIRLLTILNAKRRMITLTPAHARGDETTVIVSSVCGCEHTDDR